MDLNRYWQSVREVEAKLPDAKVYYLTSLDNADKGTTAGQVFDLPNKRQAALRLVEKTHRIATPEEVEQFQTNLKRQTEELAEIEIKRKQQFALPQELQVLVAAAAQSLADKGGRRATKEQ